MTLSTVVQISYLPSVAFEYRQDLPAVPALYFVLNSQRDVMYIGQTNNLSTRWKGHQRAIQMQAGGYRIHWYRIDDEQQRITTESQAIKYFRPPWNNSAIQVADRRRVDAYIRDVAAYMDIDPDELVCQILMEWSYRRRFGEEA
jgi:predicted GIY-YIG superfamily endonuclease